MTGNTETTSQPAAKKLPATLADVENLHFTQSRLQDGFAYLQHLADKSFPLVDNFRRDAEHNVTWDANSDLYVFTIGKTVKSADGTTKRVPHVVVCASIPSMAAIASTEAGQAFIQDALVSAFEKKIRSTFGKVDTVSLEDLRTVRLPFSAEEYMASGRGEGQDANVFKDIAKDIQAALKKNGLDITQSALKDCLSSSAVAKANYPKVAAKHWVAILEKSIALATKAGKSPAIFQHWLDTRDSASSEVALTDDMELEF